MRIMLFFIEIFCISALFSCGKVSCLTAAVEINLVSDTGAIPDTMANIVEYSKGNNFTIVVNTFDNTPLTSGSSQGNKYLGFPVSGNEIYDVYDYDWIFTLVPSGKVYKIKNFS